MQHSGYIKCSYISEQDKKLKEEITSNFTVFVDEIEPNGHILDEMISNEIIGFERCQNIELMATKELRARALLKDVIVSGNPKARRAFVESLRRDYSWLAEKIDGKVEGGVQSSSGSPPVANEESTNKAIQARQESNPVSEEATATGWNVVNERREATAVSEGQSTKRDVNTLTAQFSKLPAG